MGGKLTDVFVALEVILFCLSLSLSPGCFGHMLLDWLPLWFTRGTQSTTDVFLEDF